MKYLILIFAFLSLNSYSQLQTSGNISMSDIKTEIGVSGSYSLNDLFTLATGTFNSTYEGNHDRITNFYGYQHSGSSCNTILAYRVSGSSLDPCRDPNAIGTTIYNSSSSTVWSLYSADGTPYIDSGCTFGETGDYYYIDTQFSNTWTRWTGTGWSKTTVTCN